MRYTVDPLEEAHPDEDLSPPLVVEVRDVDRPLLRPLIGPGDKVVGGAAIAGARVGRAIVRLTSEDREIEGKLGPLRQAIRELRTELESQLTPHTTDGQELSSADAEAEFRKESEFTTLLAYAAFAVELETERG